MRSAAVVGGLLVLQVGVSPSLDDCSTTVLGCWQDSKPGDKSPGATGKRVLPYSWCPGGAKGQAAAGQCKTPDCKYEGRAAPACEAAKMTPELCAQRCLDWVATPPPSVAFTIWSGVEWTEVILPTAAPAVSNEGPSSRVLVLVSAISWLWVLAWGSLEPPRRDGENAQNTGKNGEEMGEIWSKTCEQGKERRDHLGRRRVPCTVAT